MKLSNFFTNPTRWLGAAALLTILPGCNNGFVYEDLPECRPDRRVRLSFTRNMAFDEKREEEVKHAKVFAFSDDGALADFSVSEGLQLVNDEYSVPLALEMNVPYKFITWCGTDQDVVNINSDPTETMSRTDELDSGGSDIMEGLGATVANENGIIDKKLEPVHYGNTEYTFTKMTGNDETVIDLTKDTNVIVVYLRKVTSMKGLEVYIEDKNDELDFNNNILNEDAHVKYYPVEIETNVDCPTGAGGGEYTGETVKGTKLTFHTSRLFDPAEVHNEKNMATISIIDTEKNSYIVNNEPLVKNLLLKSKPVDIAPDGVSWTTKSNQEYLDREDYYEAVFTLEDYTYIIVHINGWRTVIQNVEIKQ